MSDRFVLTDDDIEKLNGIVQNRRNTSREGTGLSDTRDDLKEDCLEILRERYENHHLWTSASRVTEIYDDEDVGVVPISRALTSLTEEGRVERLSRSAAYLYRLSEDELGDA